MRPVFEGLARVVSVRVFHEEVESWTDIDPGGYIQMKNGEKCLRMADFIEFREGRMILTKTWVRGTFSEELYEVKK